MKVADDSQFQRMEKNVTRAVVMYLYKKRKGDEENSQRHDQHIWEGLPVIYNSKRWAADFKRARDSTNDDPRSGRPKILNQ